MKSPSGEAESQSVHAVADERVVGGRYRLIESLGKGAAGEVFRGRHVLMDRQVAVKILSDEMSHRREIVERFQREARAAGEIDHPNVCAATDFGQTEDGSFFLVMEYLAGTSLQAALDADGRFDTDRAIHIAAQVCAGLARAHELGVVHRDIKPDNIMLVEQDGTPDCVKILDFGVAKLLRPDPRQKKLTAAGVVFGTPEYMPPEQAAGAPVVDSRADLYSVGVVLFELLTGALPFETDDIYALMRMHLGDEPRRMAEAAPRVRIPPALEAVVWKCLRKEPERRYQTAQELRQALLAARDRPDEVPAALAREMETGVPPRVGQRARWLAVAAVALLALGVVLVVAWPGADPAAPAGGPRGPAQPAPAAGTDPAEPAPAATAPTSARPSIAAARAAFDERAEVRAAAAQIAANDPSSAILTLGALRDAEPTNPHTHAALADAYVVAASWTDALKSYGEALRLDPRYPLEPRLADALFSRFTMRSDADARPARDLVARYFHQDASIRRIGELALSEVQPIVRRRAFEVLVHNGWLARLAAWQRLSIELRSPKRCVARLIALQELIRLDDARALPTLKLLAASTAGCGVDGQADCHACLRAELGGAIRSLEGAAPGPGGS